MASVTMATRSMPAASMDMRAITGAWWMPSQISSTMQRSSVSSTGTGPGLRWWIGFMALNRCVTMQTPQSRESRVTAASAFEWPNATFTPASVNRLVAASPCVRSTARVIIFRAGPPAAMSRSTDSGSGSRRSAGSWAPFFSSARNGPSRWMPANSPASTSPRSTVSWRSSLSMGSVTVLAKIVVEPWLRW